MLHDPVVSSSITININNFDVPTVVYNLDKSIRSRIVNFNKICVKLDVDRLFFRAILSFHGIVKDVALLTNTTNIF